MPRRMVSSMINLLFIAFALSGGVGVEASPEYFSRSWLADDGLPAPTVSDVVQDAQGFIWLATPEGIVRFDGVQFKSFTSPLITRVPAKNIRALATNVNGSVLIVSAVGGLVELAQGHFQTHAASAGLEGREIRDVFVERSGAIWLEMEGGHARRWYDGRAEDFGPEDGLNDRAITTFAESAKGEIWVASSGFVARYEDGKLHPLPGDPRYGAVVASSSVGNVWVCKGTTLRRVEGDRIIDLSTNLPWVDLGGVVRTMYEAEDSTLWIGTAAHGLFRWTQGEFKRVDSIRSQIRAIVQDNEGSLWVASDGNGLTRLRPKVFALFNSASGLAVDASDSVSADISGNVWVANRGGGVGRITNGQASILRFPAGSHRLRAYAICADDQGAVWVSEDHLYRFDAEPPHAMARVTNSIPDVHALFCSRKGDLWVGGEDGDLGRYVGCRVDAFVPEPRFTGNGIRCITEDAAGQLWIGTEAGKLFCRTKSGFVEHDLGDGLSEAPIRTVYADREGRIWAGTIGGGLMLVREGRCTRMTTEHGLADDNIAAITEDDYGRLWFGSRGGIFHVVKSELEHFADGTQPRFSSVTFGRSEGLHGVWCVGSVQPMASKTQDGQLWFATRQGVLSLDVNRMKAVRRPPRVLIDEVLVNNRPLTLTNQMKVPPSCRRIEFRFAVLSFTAPEKVRLSYRLEGVDSDWTEMAGRREAVYSGLSPGRYQFQVKACNSDGVWNEAGTALAFTVLPAWWQMRSMQGLALVGAAAGLVLAVRRWSHQRLTRKLERLEQQHALERERMRIARDLHDDLGATVTQVGLMVEELAHTPPGQAEWREQAGSVSSRVRRLARDLDAVVWSVNPGNDTLNHLAGYLSHFFLESLRHSQIRPRLQVEESIPELPLKPEIRHHLFLITKEAVNNVLKHSQATEATLGIAMSHGQFEVHIQDNGCGCDLDEVARTQRNGFRNMRARAAEIGCLFDVSSQPGTGTMIRVRLPVPMPAGDHESRR
jgi:signal transduction histidine kinase/ligand-binding sensor domain-containing protein